MAVPVDTGLGTGVVALVATGLGGVKDPGVGAEKEVMGIWLSSKKSFPPTPSRVFLSKVASSGSEISAGTTISGFEVTALYMLKNTQVTAVNKVRISTGTILGGFCFILFLF